MSSIDEINDMIRAGFLRTPEEEKRRINEAVNHKMKGNPSPLTPPKKSEQVSLKDMFRPKTENRKEQNYGDAATNTDTFDYSINESNEIGKPSQMGMGISQTTPQNASPNAYTTSVGVFGYEEEDNAYNDVERVIRGMDKASGELEKGANDAAIKTLDDVANILEDMMLAQSDENITELVTTISNNVHKAIKKIGGGPHPIESRNPATAPPPDVTTERQTLEPEDKAYPLSESDISEPENKMEEEPVGDYPPNSRPPEDPESKIPPEPEPEERKEPSRPSQPSPEPHPEPEPEDEEGSQGAIALLEKSMDSLDVLLSYIENRPKSEEVYGQSLNYDRCTHCSLIMDPTEPHYHNGWDYRNGPPEGGGNYQEEDSNKSHCRFCPESFKDDSDGSKLYGHIASDHRTNMLEEDEVSASSQGYFYAGDLGPSEFE